VTLPQWKKRRMRASRAGLTTTKSVAVAPVGDSGLFGPSFNVVKVIKDHVYVSITSGERKVTKDCWNISDHLGNFGCEKK
jgi:hypothetical protein